MRRLLTLIIVAGCVGLGFAQGIQGSVKLSGTTIIRVTGHTVTLSWDPSQGAISYNLYRSTSHGGPYTKIGSGISGTTYTDVHVTRNYTLYYVVTSVNGNYESVYSSETVVTLP